VTNITDADELKTVLKEHVDAVLGRYGKDLYAFDVINERECSLSTASNVVEGSCSSQRERNHQVFRLVQRARI
jgi:GH35 family endo-1,4-beta-xylanase